MMLVPADGGFFFGSLTWLNFMRTRQYASTFVSGRRQAGLTLLRLMLLLGTIGIVLMVAARFWLKS